MNCIHKLRGLTFLIILSLLLTTGCWDIRDVNSTAFVLAIGIDAPSNPQAKFKVTFEFAKPVSQNQDEPAQSTVASVDANGLLQAIQRIQTTISRSISLSHLRLLVVGEEIAKLENFKDLTNYLMREPETALQLRLLFVKDGQARDLFYSNRRFENRLAAEIVTMGLLQQHSALVRTKNFLNFITELNRTGGTATGSRASLDKSEKIILRDGAAIFKDWKLVSWLNAEETQGANWLFNDTEAVVIASQDDSTYTYQVTKQKTKIESNYNQENPSINVKVKAEGMILEEAGKDVDFSRPENLKKMEALFSEAIKQQVQSAIAKSQNEIKADYLGFGSEFEKHQSKAYKTLNWEEVYPLLPIQVQVNCKVKTYGLRK